MNIAPMILTYTIQNSSKNRGKDLIRLCISVFIGLAKGIFDDEKIKTTCGLRASK